MTCTNCFSAQNNGKTNHVAEQSAVMSILKSITWLVKTWSNQFSAEYFRRSFNPYRPPNFLLEEGSRFNHWRRLSINIMKCKSHYDSLKWLIIRISHKIIFHTTQLIDTRLFKLIQCWLDWTWERQNLVFRKYRKKLW